MGKTRCPFRGQSGPYRCECRALQEVFVELAVSGLASMYPAFDWWHLLAG